MNIEVTAIRAWMDVQRAHLESILDKQVRNAEQAKIHIQAQGALDVITALEAAVNKSEQDHIARLGAQAEESKEEGGPGSQPSESAQ